MQSSKCKVVGLTGPIASGKNEVAKILRHFGAQVIDADEIGHKLLTPQSDAWRQIVKTFGSKVLMAGGKVNRKRLGEMVFGDRKLLKKLDRIMHPRIKDEIKSEIRNSKSETNSKFQNKANFKTKFIVINAALLKEVGLIPLVDEVWVVTAPKAKRFGWLIKKGLTKEQALARINSQASDRTYSRIADVLIKNTGSMKKMKNSISRLFRT